jgi:hypothetical protein
MALIAGPRGAPHGFTGWLVRLLTPPDKPQARAPAPQLTETSDRLISFALACDLESVRTASEGTRNHTLYAKARALSRFAIDRTDLARDLVNAAMQAGLSETEATVTNCFDRSHNVAPRLVQRRTPSGSGDV